MTLHRTSRPDTTIWRGVIRHPSTEARFFSARRADTGYLVRVYDSRMNVLDELMISSYAHMREMYAKLDAKHVH